MPVKNPATTSPLQQLEVMRKNKEDTMKMQNIMAECADRTGLATDSHTAKRYLWTDAFAVCNFLELFHQTDEEQYKLDAFALIDQVHAVQGRHQE